MNAKTREYLFDVKSDLLTDIAFSILVNQIDKRNKELYKRGSDVRAAYTTLSDFIKFLPINEIFQKYIEEAKIIIRKDKINKIKNKIEL